MTVSLARIPLVIYKQECLDESLNPILVLNNCSSTQYVFYSHENNIHNRGVTSIGSLVNTVKYRILAPDNNSPYLLTKARSSEKKLPKIGYGTNQDDSFITMNNYAHDKIDDKTSETSLSGTLPKKIFMS